MLSVTEINAYLIIIVIIVDFVTGLYVAVMT